jgi:DNA-binding transcriptional MerR regulator
MVWNEGTNGMSGLLRKKDVVEQVGAAKSTISDWIKEFSAFIPAVQDGTTIYYKTEAIDVLKAVKEYREMDMSKTQIAEQLAQKFAVNADEVANEISQAKRGESERSDAMIAVMTTMGKVVEQLGRSDERIRQQDDKMAAYERELKELREQVAVSKEKTESLEKYIESEKNKGFFARLFKK